MVSTFTPNIQLEEPARGDDVGTWDTPVNGNMTLVDLVAGGIATISLNNSPVVLSAAQFRSKTITFNSTLTGSVTITFPTSFTKSYEIQNLCTGSSAFTVTLSAPSSLSGTFISCPPGEIIDVVNDGTNIKFKNFGRVGSLMEWGGSSVPNWISFCGTNNAGFSPVPYLNCDGTAFSSAAYPALTVFLGGTTLPDIRGTTRYTLNQGTGRITTANAGLDGNTNLSVKATPTTVIQSSNLPPYTPAGNVSVTSVGMSGGVGSFFLNNTGILQSATGGGALAGYAVGSAQQLAVLSSGTLTGTPAPGQVSNALPVIGTGTVAGITMIRAG